MFSAPSRGGGARYPSAEGENAERRKARRSRARKEMPRYLDSDPLLRYYRIILKRGHRTVERREETGAPASFSHRCDRYFARTRGTRVKISPVMHRKFGHGRLPLPKGRSMQIRHEISLIVVCRMTEPGNRPFCGSRSDRPKTATRRRCRGIAAMVATDAAPNKRFKAPFAS